jgi:hypothetical protein
MLRQEVGFECTITTRPACLDHDRHRDRAGDLPVVTVNIKRVLRVDYNMASVFHLSSIRLRSVMHRSFGRRVFCETMPNKNQ